MSKLICSVVLFVLAQSSWSNNLQEGNTAPDLTINERGELVLVEDEIEYRSWQYPQETGKIHVVNYMAATMAASKLNRPFTDRLQEELEKGSYHVTTILNLDDAMWGTTGFVVSEVKANKKKHPGATLVLDEEAVGLDTWKLERKNSAIVIVDSAGTIHYVKQGAMSEDEINSAIEMIRSLLDSASS